MFMIFIPEQEQLQILLQVMHAKVIGIEYVDEAVKDAIINSEINNIKNTHFFSGDMKDVLSEQFINDKWKT